MADKYAMKSGSKMTSDAFSEEHGQESIDRDKQEMARLGKRQELRVSYHSSYGEHSQLTSESVTLAS